MNAKLQKQLEGLSARVERLQKTLDSLPKPPARTTLSSHQSGQRDIIAELVARAVDGETRKPVPRFWAVQLFSR